MFKHNQVQVDILKKVICVWFWRAVPLFRVHLKEWQII